jgi:hypothetical protein
MALKVDPQSAAPPRLDDLVRAELAQGARIESRSELSAVVVHGSPVRHRLHLFAAIVTVGLWCPVWLYLAVFRGEQRVLVFIDQDWNRVRRKV